MKTMIKRILLLGSAVIVLSMVLFTTSCASKSNSSALEAQLQTTQKNLSQAEAEVATLQAQLSAAQAKVGMSLQPPYTSISGRKITWAWEDTSGNLHEWTLDIDTYRAYVEQPRPTQTVTLTLDNGTNLRYEDYRPYITLPSSPT